MKFGLFIDVDKICYNTLNYFILNIENVLNRRGIQTEYLARIDSTVIHNKYDALVGINCSEPSVRSGDGRYLIDFFGCPFFNIVVDAPYYHHDSLKVHGEKLHLVFVDEGHVRYYMEHYPPCESVEMGYLLGPVGEPVPYGKRTIDLLFMGSCPDYEHIKQEVCSEKYSMEQRKLFLYLIEQGISCPDKATDELVRDYLAGLSLPVELDDFNLIMNNIGVQAEYYLRGYYRAKIIRLLVDAGLNVTVAGGDWAKLFPEHPENLVILGAIDMMETGNLIADCKILLNVMPWFKEGLHDRVPTAMLNGAVCVTDSTTYTDTHFQDNEDIVLYRLDELDKLPGKCRYLLEHTDEAKVIAQAGKHKAEREYTWERFVTDYILKWM